MNIVKKFLTESSNAERSGAVWNMIASMLLAFQSVILLVVMTHTVGLIPAGIYTMGNTDNNLFLSIGKYGMRYFQVSDVSREYKFREYRMSRIISTIAMAVISMAYVLFVANRNGYDANKTLIIIWMCLFKLPDAFEDVYYGDYQKNERLDVASKCLALRMFLTVVLWAVLIVVIRDLLTTVIITTIVTTIIMFVFLMLTREFVTEREGYSMRRVWKLLLVTLPLCVGAFMVLYIGAAPRNAIDAHMDDEAQAIYGFIAMPVFVVQLLVLFIFNPLIYGISCLWNDGKIREFTVSCLKQIGIVVVLTIVCIMGAWLLGIPVLSVFYHTDLTPYKTDLLLMMVGSGFLGLATLLGNLLTVMRYQNAILVGYIIVSVIAFLFSSRAVIAGGIRGAVVFYLILLGVLSLIFLAEFIYGIIKKRSAA